MQSSKADPSKKQTTSGMKKKETFGKQKAVAGANLQGIASAAADPLTASAQDLLSLNHIVGNASTHSLIQAKLKVGPVNDKYEAEADRKAAEVLQADPEKISSQENPGFGETLQLKPVSGRSSSLGEQDSEFESRLMRQNQSGSSLPDGLRSYMQDRFKADFSSVRIHNDSKAAELSENVSAKAFTHGNHIYFNSGQFQPGTAEGKRLVAHELTHVIQQSGGESETVQRAAATTTTAKTFEDYKKKKSFEDNWLVDKATGDEVGLGLSAIDAAGQITSLSANDERDKKTASESHGQAETAGTSLGLIASIGSLAQSGLALGKAGQTYHRGRRLGELGGPEGSTRSRYAQRIRRRGRLDTISQSANVLGAASNIVSGALSLDGKDEVSNGFGGAGSSIGAASSLFGSAISGRSLRVADKRKRAAAEYQKGDTKELADFVHANQNVGGKSLNLLGGLSGSIGGGLGAWKSFGNVTGKGGDVLGGLSTALSLGGSLASVGSKYLNKSKVGDKDAHEQKAKELAENLVQKIEDKNAEFINFAKTVLAVEDPAALVEGDRGVAIEILQEKLTKRLS